MVTALKIYIPTNSFLPQPLLPTSSIAVRFLDDSHSYWDKIILICILLVVQYGEHFLIYLAICSSLGDFLLSLFIHLLIRLFPLNF